jgi:microcystin-dependent protein
MADAYVGEIRAFAFNFTPTGWLPCDGSLQNINANTTLFSVLGIRFGGDGQTTFAVPDLRGVAALGIDTTNPSYNQPGINGGSEGVTLTTGTMPAHNHMIQAVVRTSQPQTAAAISQPGPDAYLTNAYSIGLTRGIVVYSNNQGGTTLSPQTIGATGGSTPHQNMDPYLAMTYCICSSGIYPPHS